MIVGIEVGVPSRIGYGERGRFPTVHKLPSTPSDLSVAAVNGLEALLKSTHSEAQGVAELLHGSTIAANALIQRRGAATVLLTTRGFRDVLFIQRQDKSTDTTCSTATRTTSDPRLYLRGRRAPGADGGVVTPLNEEGAGDLIDRIVEEHTGQSRSACCTLMPIRHTSKNWQR